MFRQSVFSILSLLPPLSNRPSVDNSKIPIPPLDFYVSLKGAGLTFPSASGILIEIPY